jgi:ketosteroid isomerase-like protein
MKIYLAVALVGLAIGFAAPTFAQEQNTVDPEVRQQIETLLMKFGEAFNKYDPAAIAALYTQNAIRLESWWSEGAFGQQAIEKSYAGMLASMPGEFIGKVVQVYPIGNDMCVITKDSEERHGRVTKHGSAIVTPILGRSAWNTSIDRRDFG